MKRQPAGVPTGGQFAEDRKAEPSGSLSVSSHEALTRTRLQPLIDQAGHHGLRQNLVQESLRQAATLDQRTLDATWSSLAHLKPEARSEAYRLRINDAYDSLMLRLARRDGTPEERGSGDREYLEALSYYGEVTGTLHASRNARGHRRMISDDVVLGEDAEGNEVVVSMTLENDLTRTGEDGGPGQWVSTVSFNHRISGPEAVDSVVVGTQRFESAELGVLETLYSERTEPKPAGDVTAALEFFARNSPRNVVAR